MFTGIINHQGLLTKIINSEDSDTLIEIEIDFNKITRELKIGCSISCNGICLTLVSMSKNHEKMRLTFEASNETFHKTTIKFWQLNQLINLEFAMQMQDEFGGHLVTGHIDNITQILNITHIKSSWQFDFAMPNDAERFIAKKGSITVDGTSLTVNSSSKKLFSVNIIDHTFNNTCFKNYKIDDFVNIEYDLIARYLSQLLTKKYHE